jgi:hypothetical protein
MQFDRNWRSGNRASWNFVFKEPADFGGYFYNHINQFYYWFEISSQ